MELKPDCIRDILMYVEEKLMYSEDLHSTQMNEVNWNELFNDKFLSSEYQIDDIKYSLQKLKEAGYIKCITPLAGKYGWKNCDITQITWEGHEFLNTVRSKPVWDATKEKAKSLGVMSIKTLSTFAMAIVQAIVTSPQVVSDVISRMPK